MLFQTITGICINKRAFQKNFPVNKDYSDKSSHTFQKTNEGTENEEEPDFIKKLKEKNYMR